MANVCVAFAIFVINGFDIALPPTLFIPPCTKTTNTSPPLSLMYTFLYVLYEVFYGLGFYDNVCAFCTISKHVPFFFCKNFNTIWDRIFPTRCPLLLTLVNEMDNWRSKYMEKCKFKRSLTHLVVTKFAVIIGQCSYLWGLLGSGKERGHFLMKVFCLSWLYRKISPIV